MHILIIGGTRNLGHMLTLELLYEGHRVTLFNRGQTPNELPKTIRRIQGDRGNPSQLARAFSRRFFDVVVDTTLYNGRDAETVIRMLSGRVGHYIFISTGQVYLVHQNVQRPSTEDHYHGPVMEAPPQTRDYEEWSYGVEKREAEDILFQAWETHQFPFTTLRLPMVNSERDHFHRIYGYMLRLKDKHPILIPTDGQWPLRHVYVKDVVKTIASLINTGNGVGCAYNISQDETLTIQDFLSLLAQITGDTLHIKPISRERLEARNSLPDCSPFSDAWMSELDNRLSKKELGILYTPLPIYLEQIVAHYKNHSPPTPQGYLRRQDEIQLADRL